MFFFSVWVDGGFLVFFFSGRSEDIGQIVYALALRTPFYKLNRFIVVVLRCGFPTLFFFSCALITVDFLVRSPTIHPKFLFSSGLNAFSPQSWKNAYEEYYHSWVKGDYLSWHRAHAHRTSHSQAVHEGDEDDAGYSCGRDAWAAMSMCIPENGSSGEDINK